MSNIKYIPIIASRDVELQLLEENQNELVMPFVKLIKEKYRNNSKQNIIDYLQKIQYPFFVQVMKGHLKGNVQESIQKFMYSMMDDDLFIKWILEINSKLKNATIVLELAELDSLPIETTKVIKTMNIAILLKSVAEISRFETIYAEFNPSYVFVEFNEYTFKGANETNFSNFYNKHKNKIIYVFNNHPIKYKNIDASVDGREITNTITTTIDKFPVDRFGDYVTLRNDELPAEGGMLSPGLIIQLTQNIMLHKGAPIASARDAEYKQYTMVTKNMFRDERYQSIKSFKSAKSYKLLEEANVTSNEHFITPVKAKYITMDHYITLILDLLKN